MTNNFDHFIGTQAVAESQKFDVEALAAYLQAQLPGFKGPLQVEQFKGGQSNPTFKLITSSGHYVMRAKPGPAARLLQSAHAIDREFTVMKALAASDVPVARMHLLCEDESIIGRAFYIMDFVEGRVLWDQSLPGMSNSERGEIYDEMNRVISELHQVDFKAVGLAEFGKPGNYFARQVSRWSKQYQASITQPIAAMEKLIQWLPEHIPTDDSTSIVHGDFRLDNLIFHASQPRVLAVLDWELSTLGHPLADFSYHCMAWHIPPGAFRGIAGLDYTALGIPTEREYIARYMQRTGRMIEGDWNFYLAYNLFRIAAILQGIAKRVEEGTASSAQARQAAAGAKPLAELGLSFAMKSGARP
jgi:aminoglycoside phosphotransferase (APT) family kinase protein